MGALIMQQIHEISVEVSKSRNLNHQEIHEHPVPGLHAMLIVATTIARRRAPVPMILQKGLLERETDSVHMAFVKWCKLRNFDL